MDREKVIAWLADEELYYRDHGDTHNSLMACYALDLLKEQEDLGTELTNAVELIHKKNERIEKLLKEHTFTVIDTKTGKEADEYEIALHEDWAKYLCCCDMNGWAIMDDGTLLLVDECGQYAYADRERFKVKWE